MTKIAIRVALPLLCAVLFGIGSATAISSAELLDSFETAAGWTAVAPGGSQAAVASGRGRSGPALRIDFDFRKGGGEAMVHKAFPMRLPANFALRFEARMDGASHPVEVRLIDPSGQNVWRFQDGEFQIGGTWREARLKRRRFQFGWGPAGGRPPEALGQIEFLVGRGAGGHGTLWIGSLRLEPLEPVSPPAGNAKLTASASRPGQGPEHLLDETPANPWHSAAHSAEPWLAIDFGAPREYGGLIIDWDPADYAQAYRVEQSTDGRHWQEVYRVRDGNGQRDDLPLHEAESRYLRLRMERSGGAGYGIRRIEIAPLDFSASPNHTFQRLAREAPRGLYPRYFLGEQPYWTVAGSAGTVQAGADREALLNTDGAIEVDEAAFSVEPFLYFDNRLWTWADGTAMPSLESGSLPIPTVRLTRGPLSLEVTALADGDGEDFIHARYRIENRGSQPVSGNLFLAVRPFLVNPPWQSQHSAGGAARIDSLRSKRNTLWVNGRPGVVPLASPAAFGGAEFDGDLVAHALARNTVPTAQAISDSRGWATGAFKYPFALAPGETSEAVLAFPSKHAHSQPPVRDAHRLWADRYAHAVQNWEEALGRVEFRLPAEEKDWADAVRANLAYILIHRDGPALRPGSRRYGRTWVRDAAITSAALLALGHNGEVREFLRWYAGFAGADGSVPCCLDPWGPDSMIEHDSGGEFLYTLSRYVRYSGDRAFGAALWPQAQRTAEYLAQLRRQRLGSAYDEGDAARFRGLLPESVSHEGYMGHPVHSYWDDFWAVRGLADTAWLADALGEPAKAAEYAKLGKALQGDIARSVAATQARAGIDFVPGCAELADLDPTSTAIALSLGVEPSKALLPSLRRTFARYTAEAEARIAGTSRWQSYAPYEFRNVAALVRLGERDAALRAMRNLLEGRRPAGWNQWPEIVWRDPDRENFLGDLPHGWIGAEFIQAFLTLFAYEDPAGRLVLGAGLPRAWVDAPGGTGISRLRTPFGPLSYQADAPAPGVTRIRIEGGLVTPPAGIAVDLPFPQRPARVTVNGQSAAMTEAPVLLKELPAEVVFHTEDSTDPARNRP